MVPPSTGGVRVRGRNGPSASPMPNEQSHFPKPYRRRASSYRRPADDALGRFAQSQSVKPPSTPGIRH